MSATQPYGQIDESGLAAGYNVPPEVKLGEMAYRRDALFEAAARNRAGAQDRLDELAKMKRKGELREDYDVMADHRYAGLIAGAETFERDGAKAMAEHDAFEAGLRGIVERVRSGSAKRAVPGKQKKPTEGDDS